MSRVARACVGGKIVDVPFIPPRFLHQTVRHEFLPLADSDVEACLFELHDRTAAAAFQSRLHPQWLDERIIELDLNPRQVQVCTQTAHTVWPERPPGKGDDDANQLYRMRLKEDRWLRAMRMNYDDFRRLIQSARGIDELSPASHRPNLVEAS